MSMAKQWSRLPREATHAPSLGPSNPNLTKPCETWSELMGDPAVSRRPLQVLSTPNYALILHHISMI